MQLEPIKQMVEALVCPIELEPLTEAVLLLPCCHRVNEKAATILSSNATQEDQIPSCPVCRIHFTEYKPDLLIRELAQLTLCYREPTYDFPDEQLYRVDLEIENHSFCLSSILQRIGQRNGKEDIVHLTLISQEQEGLFHRVTYSGNPEGSLSLAIEFPEELDLDKIHHILRIDREGLSHRFTTEDPEQLHAIHDKIKIYARLPQQWQNFIDTMVETGNWQAIPLDCWQEIDPGLKDVR